MNDIFKIFKKRAQAGKSTNIKDVIKDLSENEKDEIGKFDRGNKSYLSISKSGRLKSKKASAQSANAHRKLNEDLFRGPVININGCGGSNNLSNGKAILAPNRSLASSANSSFRSSLEDVDDMVSSASSSSGSSSINNEMQMTVNKVRYHGEIIDYESKTNGVWQNKF